VETYCTAGGRPQMKIRRMRIAFWVLKATNTHSEHVILIGFPPQLWLHDRASNVTLYVRCICLLLVFDESLEPNRRFILKIDSDIREGFIN